MPHNQELDLEYVLMDFYSHQAFYLEQKLKFEQQENLPKSEMKEWI